jgi:hypothetical protein
MLASRTRLTVRKLMGCVAAVALLLAPAATQFSLAVALGVALFGIVLVTALILLAGSVTASLRDLFRDLGGPSI